MCSTPVTLAVAEFGAHGVWTGSDLGHGYLSIPATGTSIGAVRTLPRLAAAIHLPVVTTPTCEIKLDRKGLVALTIYCIYIIIIHVHSCMCTIDDNYVICSF